MRASPQQQRLGPLPSSSPFPPNCNPQRCDICPGTTSEGDFHGWSKRTTRELRMELRDKLGTSFKFFISCDTVNQIPFPYDHVLLTMAHFDVAPVVACVVLTFTAMPCAQVWNIGGPIKTFSARLVLHRSSIGVSTYVYRSVVRCRSGHHRRAQVRLRRLEVGPQTHRHHRCAGPEQQTRRAH